MIQVQQSLLAPHNRLDAPFATLVQAHKNRADELCAQLSIRQAQAALDQVPADLVHTACLALSATNRTPSKSQTLQDAQKHPFLALALIESALPEFQAQHALRLQALEQEKQALNVLASEVFVTPSARKPFRLR